MKRSCRRPSERRPRSRRGAAGSTWGPPRTGAFARFVPLGAFGDGPPSSPGRPRHRPAAQILRQCARVARARRGSRGRFRAVRALLCSPPRKADDHARKDERRRNGAASPARNDRQARLRRRGACLRRAHHLRVRRGMRGRALGRWAEGPDDARQPEPCASRSRRSSISPTGPASSRRGRTKSSAGRTKNEPRRCFARGSVRRRPARRPCGTLASTASRSRCRARPCFAIRLTEKTGRFER